MSDELILDQRKWIHDYNDQTREKFTESIFNRSDYEVIESLKKVALSCQRDSYFSITVTGFNVIEDYDTIMQTLRAHEQKRIDKNKNNSKKTENPYDFIDLKTSAIMLLVIDYHIEVHNEEKPEQGNLRVILEVPRIVDKYYYYIRGNLYLAVHQIVDGSTYNNTASSSKKQSITYKTMFMPIRLYRNTFTISDVLGTEIKYTIYISRIFNKNVPVVEYFLAKFGLRGTLDFLGLNGVISIFDRPFDKFEDGQWVYDDEVFDDEENEVVRIAAERNYVFRKENVYFAVPRYIYEQDLVVQCVLTTIMRRVKEGVTCTQLYDQSFWLETLSIRFNSKPSVEKGLSVLDSLESTYDIITKEDTKLPLEDKADIYCILRWTIREFNRLRLKDNTDISTKKIRRADYIAAKYAAKVSKGIYRASDNQRKVTVDDIKRYIFVEPEFLIDMISKDKLVNYRNCVNDNDAILAAKYSYKGNQGLETTTPDSYRRVHHSHVGRVDLDASSATDPGLTGIICPMADINNHSFADVNYEEPNQWREDFEEVKKRYIELKGKMQLVEFHKQMKDIFDIINEETKENIEFAMDQELTALDAIGAAEESVEYRPVATSEIDDDLIVIFDDDEDV